MESAPPRDGRRALAMAMAIGLLAACSDSVSQRCENGSYCPEGTRCGGGSFCLVEEASCGDFGTNAPCVSAAGGEGFCAAGACRAGVEISGRVTNAGGGPVVEGRVTALDREWMEGVDTDNIGGFTIEAVQNDTDLVLRIEGNDVRPALLSRRLALGTGDYAINGDATASLRVPTRAELREWADRIEDIQPDPSHGAVAVQIGSEPGRGIANATATLAGPTDRPPLYFKGGADGGPDFDARTTSAGEPTALFLELEPGTYTLKGDRSMATDCRAAGDDRPDPIVVDVRAGELTAAGWIICRQ